MMFIHKHEDILVAIHDLKKFDFASGHWDKDFVEEVNKQITKLYVQNQKQMIELSKGDKIKDGI